jgi:hypothetical protein
MCDGNTVSTHTLTVGPVMQAGVIEHVVYIKSSATGAVAFSFTALGVCFASYYFPVVFFTCAKVYVLPVPRSDGENGKWEEGSM